MSITFTEDAKARIAKICGTSPFRIAVDGGACQGFQYVFDIVDAKAPDDEEFDLGEASVVVDQASLPFLLGSTVDYVSTLAGERFEVSNPNAVSTCGCGTSFSV
jgi:iron-sulfur cluster assembly accessory protein|nr:iron-sulfur cluster assembly accessory protein [Neorhizobium tomejilense]